MPPIISTFLLLFATSLFCQQVRVDKIKFVGNKTVSASKLSRAILTRGKPWTSLIFFWQSGPEFDEDILLQDLLRIERFYQREGYLQARVKDYELKYSSKNDRVKVKIVVEEGKPTRVESVAVMATNGVELPIPADRLEAMLTLKPGKRYREEDLTLDHARLVERFSNRGYPYIQAKVRPVMDEAQHRVRLEWHLEPGPLCYFGDITITGNQSVSDDVIRRGLGFRTGRPFVQSRLTDAQSQVYRLELFQFVSLRATNLDQRPEYIPIEVRVRESVPRTLKLGIGYGSEELFRASAQWRNRNFFGGARILRMLAKHSTEILPLQLQIELSQPYFFSNKNDLLLKPFFTWEDERSYDAKRVGLEATLNRQLTRRTNVFFSPRVEHNRVLGATGSVTVETNTSVFVAGIRRNSTDQLFSPTRGHISSFVLEEAGRFLRSDFKYLKFYTEHRFFKQVRPGHVLATRMFVGAMKPIRGSLTTPIEERF
ncbi:MAG TPA: POTRA domain-containing protein, partial [bacterium]